MARKNRILHLILQPGFGGMEKRVARLAHGLDPAVFEITVASFRPAQGKRIELPERTRLVEFPIPSGLHWGRLRALAAWIRSEGFDVVHTHNWSTMFYGLLAARLAGTKVRLHGEHGLNLEDLKGPSLKRRLAQGLLARLATRIVAVNAVIAAHVKDSWKARDASVLVLNNGVDLERFRPVPWAPRPPDKPFAVGTVARFDKVKDIGTQIRALALCKQAHPEIPVKLVLVGDGPDKAMLTELAASQGVAAEVEFAGETLQVEDWYPRFDAYLNSSVYEGMSNTLLEAMACGLPLLATGVAGNRVWLDQDAHAWFFEPGDAPKLAELFARMARDVEGRNAMGARNRAKVEQDYDNQDFLIKYRRLYRELLMRRPAAGRMEIPY